LLAAGLELFSRRGYDGTSVRALAAAAGVNLGAMTYHFGTKRELYDRVVERAVAPLAEAVEAAVTGGDSPLERLEAVVRTYFDFVGEHPEVLRLLIQELLLDRLPPPAAQALMRRTHGALLALVRAGQEDGTIRRGIPELLAVNIISAPIHMALVKQPLQVALGFDLANPRERDRAVQHLQEFTRAALAAKPEVTR